MIFDSHAHYDDKGFSNDRDKLLKSLPESGVCAVVNCGSDLETSKNSIELSHKYNYIFAAIGVHPLESEKISTDFLEQLQKFSLDEKVVAIGEIGLDYHYGFPDKSIQKNVFETQLELANSLDLPVIIHDREAHQDTMDLLAKYRPKGVVHCFSGSVEMAKEVIRLGMYIGLGGVVTFKNAKNPVKVAQEIPLDRILLETDAPYMAPVPMRGTRCDSSLINYTAEKIAQIRQTSKEDILQSTKNNAIRLFNVKIH